MAALSLFEALARLPDPRSRHGRIHPFPAMIGLIVLAMLMGRTGPNGIARFGRQYGPPLAHALGFRRGKTPAASRLSTFLRALDVVALEAALSMWVRSRIGPFEHISIDGKTLRGSRDGDLPGHHLVAAYAPAVEAVLAQVRVDAKTNEHKAALELLGLLPIKGKVVIGDAMFCQRDLAEQVTRQEADYILIAKDNQPALQADVRAGLAFATAARAIAAAAPPWGGGCAARRPRASGDTNR